MLYVSETVSCMDGHFSQRKRKEVSALTDLFMGKLEPADPMALGPHCELEESFPWNSSWVGAVVSSFHFLCICILPALHSIILICSKQLRHHTRKLANID